MAVEHKVGATTESVAVELGVLKELKLKVPSVLGENETEPTPELLAVRVAEGVRVLGRLCWRHVGGSIRTKRNTYDTRHIVYEGENATPDVEIFNSN